jgi:hypothetical protein
MVRELPPHEFTPSELESIDFAARAWDLTEFLEEQRAQERPELPIILQQPSVYDSMYRYAGLGHPVAMMYMGIDQL